MCNEILDGRAGGDVEHETLSRRPKASGFNLLFPITRMVLDRFYLILAGIERGYLLFMLFLVSALDLVAHEYHISNSSSSHLEYGTVPYTTNILRIYGIQRV